MKEVGGAQCKGDGGYRISHTSGRKSAAVTPFSELLQKFSVRVHCGVYVTWRMRGFHVHMKVWRNCIGLAVRGVRLVRKRLPSLSGTFLALPESELSQVKR